MKQFRNALCLLLVLLLVLIAVGCSGAPQSKKEEPKPQTSQTTPPSTPQPTPAPTQVTQEQPKQEAPKAAPQMKDPWEGAVDVSTVKVPEKANRKYKIGISIPHLRDSFWVASAYGYFDEAKKYGVDIVLLNAGGYEYVDKQVNQVEDLIAKKVDLIAVAAVDAQGIVPVVERAAQAKIPVVNMNCMVNTDKVIRIAPADFEIGVAEADFIGEKLGGKGNVVMLNGPPGATWSTTRVKSFKATMESKFPGIKILGEQWSEVDRAKAMSIMEDFLQKFPTIDGVYCSGNLLSAGAADAVNAAGKGGKTIVCAGAMSQPEEELVKKGLIQLVTGERCVDISRTVIRVAVSVLNGENVPRLVKVPLQRITPENIDKFDRGTEFSPPGWSVPLQ